MDFRLSEEQEELCSMARSFLEEHSGPEQVRSAMETELGYDPDTWKLIATELCWPCIHIPEEYGGLGLSHVDLMLLLEATGESLLCAPFFSTVALGANGILELASDEQKASILPSIAEGTTTATLAFAERPGRWDAEGVQATATADGDGFVLEGEKCWARRVSRPSSSPVTPRGSRAKASPPWIRPGSSQRSVSRAFASRRMPASESPARRGRG
jgi:alkylation response protein AidB-like acyl-CoA dehydrogenase